MIEFLFECLGGIAVLALVFVVGRFVHHRMVLVALQAYRKWQTLASIHPYIENDPVVETYSTILSIISPDGSTTGSFSTFPNSREKFTVQLGESYIHITPSRNLISTINKSNQLPIISLPFKTPKQINANLFLLESGEWLFIPASPLLFSMAKRVK